MTFTCPASEKAGGKADRHGEDEKAAADHSVFGRGSLDSAQQRHVQAADHAARSNLTATQRDSIRRTHAGFRTGNGCAERDGIHGGGIVEHRIVLDNVHADRAATQTLAVVTRSAIRGIVQWSLGRIAIRQFTMGAVAILTAFDRGGAVSICVVAPPPPAQKWAGEHRRGQQNVQSLGKHRVFSRTSVCIVRCSCVASKLKVRVGTHTARSAGDYLAHLRGEDALSKLSESRKSIPWST